MFDRYVGSRSATQSRWVKVGIAISVAAHIGVGGALIISAAWQLDRLSIEDSRVGVASLGLPTAAPPPLASSKRERVEKKIPVPEPRQPDETAPTAPDDTGSTGEPDGHVLGKPGGEGTDLNSTNTVLGCQGIDCIETMPPPPPPEPRQDPPIVTETALKGYLISGKTQIRPPETVKHAMLRSGKDRVDGVVRLCIDERGAITQSKLLSSTGHPDYDRRLVAGVRSWRYQPYTRDGKPIAVCTAIRFVYVLRK